METPLTSPTSQKIKKRFSIFFLLDEYILKNKFCEIEDLFLFTDRFLAK